MREAGWSDTHYATYDATWNTNSIYINNPSTATFTGIDFNNGQAGTGTERYQIVCDAPNHYMTVFGYISKVNYPYSTLTYAYQMTGALTTYETDPGIPAGTYFCLGRGMAVDQGTIYSIVKIA